MEIIELLNYKEIRFQTAIALGNFDGIHIGHQELIKSVVAKSKELGIKSSLLLFKEHTKAIIDNSKPYMITNNYQKFNIARELGVDIVYLIDFNSELMSLSPEEFVKDIIIDKMNGKLVIVGFDYRFGHKASGDTTFLKELSEKHKFDLLIVNPVLKNEKIVSSTGIREMISLGKMYDVSKMLGRPYSIIGTVVHGKNRGNKLGFPTANIKPVDNYIIPKTGVYFTNTTIENKKYISATNIGYNPTFNENILKIETYILDFTGDLYDKSIEIEFIDFLRDDIKFDNKEALINQMEEDIKLIKNRH